MNRIALFMLRLHATHTLFKFTENKKKNFHTLNADLIIQIIIIKIIKMMMSF